jgi:heptosyltransferase II
MFSAGEAWGSQLVWRGARFACHLANAAVRLTRRRPQQQPVVGAALRRVVIHVPNWLGDCVMALPAAEQLRAACPNATITVVTRPAFRDLWDSCPNVDRILTFDRFEERFSFTKAAAMVRQLRAGAFEAAVILPTGIEFALLYALARIDIRAGYDFDQRRFLLTYPLHAGPDFRTRHLAESYGELVSLFGAPPPRRSPQLRQTSWSVRVRARRDRVQVILHPCASYGPAKRWPAQRFAELGRRLSECCAAQVVLVGTTDGSALAAEINAGMDFRAVDLTGRTSLSELIDLMRDSALVISTDSGPAHLADALGVPLIVLFGSTSPHWTGPRGANSEVIHHAVECSPCFAQICRLRTMACFDRITPDEVFTRALKWLGGPAA